MFATKTGDRTEFSSYEGMLGPHTDLASSTVPSRSIHSGPRAVSVLLIPVIEDDQVGLVVIRRLLGREPGKLALPGGYVGDGEDWQKTGQRKALEKACLSLSSQLTITPAGVHSVQDGRELVVYGLTESLQRSELPDFNANEWASERQIIFAPQELAFPTHTEMVQKFFAETAPRLRAELAKPPIVLTNDRLDLLSLRDLPPPQPLVAPNWPGVTIKQLRSFFDDRGFFREIVRASDRLTFGQSFAQMSHSWMVRDTVKAWHVHSRQWDWWYVPHGVVEAVLFDDREESPTRGEKFVLRMGDRSQDASAHEVCVGIPPGVLHGVKVLSPQASLVYLTSNEYDPGDEGRRPFDWRELHNWGDHIIVDPKDRELIDPKYERTLTTDMLLSMRN